MSILELLEKAVSQDQNAIRLAQEALEQIYHANPGEYFLSLSEVLANKDINGYVRMLAGLQLKNCLTSKDEKERVRQKEKWLSFGPLSDRIKMNVLRALGTETSRPSASPQCIAYIAAIELPNRPCGDMIKALIQNATRPDIDEATRVAALEALGYIGQEVSPELLSPFSDEMLTAIVFNIHGDKQSNLVKATAINALLNSLDFIRGNFENVNERNHIMQVLCEATQCGDVGVQVAALECLVAIMSLFYQYMEAYMSQALFPITLHAIKSNIPKICLQGLEFWTSVAEEELKLQHEAEEAALNGRPPQRTSKFYAKGSLQYFVPLLLNVLTQQDEDTDEDEWNPCKSAGICLGALSNCTGNDIIPHVLPFIGSNIDSPDWHKREAAMVALGSILDSPSNDQLQTLVQEALPRVINLVRDSHVWVRDTSTWVLSVICQNLPLLIFQPEVLKLVLDVLMEALRSEPRIAIHSCVAFGALFTSANDIALNAEGADEYPKSNSLSEYFEPVLQQILQCTERSDSLINNLRTTAFETLMEMIKNSPQDCYEVVRQITMVILDKLNRLLNLENAGSIDQNLIDIQTLLSSTLEAVLKRMIPEDVEKIADTVMTVSLRMLELAATKTQTVNEDALLILTCLARALEKKFVNYLPAVTQYLNFALRGITFEIHTTLTGIISDLCQSVGEEITPFCDHLSENLLHAYASNELPAIKSQILYCFGDIVFAVGPKYKYLPQVLGVLIQLIRNNGSFNFQNNLTLSENIEENWEVILGTFSPIVQSLKDSEQASVQAIQAIQPNLVYINQFLLTIASKCEELEDDLINQVIGFIHDLIQLFNVEMIAICEHPIMQQVFNRGKKSKTSKSKSLVYALVKEIKRVKYQLQNATSQALPNNQPGQAFAPQIHNTAPASW